MYKIYYLKPNNNNRISWKSFNTAMNCRAWYNKVFDIEKEKYNYELVSIVTEIDISFDDLTTDVFIEIGCDDNARNYNF